MFKKTSKQIDAVKLLSSFQMHSMFFGGSRSGKTFILFRSLIIRALKCPRSRHVIFRGAFAHIKSSIYYNTYPDVMRKCFSDLSRGAHYFDNKTDWFIEFYNESQIWLAGLDEGERTDKILGQEYSTIWFNEASQIKYDAITTALTRLSQKNNLNIKAWYDMNPPTKSHWSYKIFIKGVDPNSKQNKELRNKEDFAYLKMNPLDNIDNLPQQYINLLKGLTGKQRQRFLEGEFADDIEGALWSYEMISDSYIDIDIDSISFDKLAVAIDPAITAKATSDETGIIWGGKSGDDYYICDDLSGIYKVSEWARIACQIYEKECLTAIVAETNQGGDMVEHAIKTENDYVNFVQVRATRGKYKRAEPVAQLYEKGLVKHVKHFKLLEDQMLSYTPLSDESPDRLDALVWLLTYLSKDQISLPGIIKL
jgi:PBSX family phage terminase large subunit